MPDLFSGVITPRPGSFRVSDMRETLDLPDPKGSHPQHAVHENSRAAFKTVPISARESEVLTALKVIGRPATDREVCERLGKADLNYARPAISGMVKVGTLVEVVDVVCPVTGRKVRTVYFGEGSGA